jgi:hypothetical protein
MLHNVHEFGAAPYARRERTAMLLCAQWLYSGDGLRAFYERVINMRADHGYGLAVFKQKAPIISWEKKAPICGRRIDSSFVSSYDKTI